MRAPFSHGESPSICGLRMDAGFENCLATRFSTGVAIPEHTRKLFSCTREVLGWASVNSRGFTLLAAGQLANLSCQMKGVRGAGIQRKHLFNIVL